MSYRPKLAKVEVYPTLNSLSVGPGKGVAGFEVEFVHDSAAPQRRTVLKSHDSSDNRHQTARQDTAIGMKNSFIKPQGRRKERRNHKDPIFVFLLQLEATQMTIILFCDS